MAILKPDNTSTLNGVKINEYLLTKHNPNSIAMPTVSMEGKVIGITVHNTDWISVASGTTPCRTVYQSNLQWQYERCQGALLCGQHLCVAESTFNA